MSFKEEADKILSTLPTEIPEWGKSLIGLVKCLMGELSSVREIVALKSTIEIQGNVIEKLAADNKRLNKKLNDIEQTVDNNEQHDRNINLILRGVPEEKDEDTTKTFINKLNEHLPVKLVTKDVTRSHRLGRKIDNKSRPIIARFAIEEKKMEVFRSKRHLKGKGISLAENLTKSRVEIYKAAIAAHGHKNVWTWEGRVFLKVNEEKIHLKKPSDIPAVAGDLTMNETL